MSIKEVVENNIGWVVKRFGDSWHYDAIMELYAKGFINSDIIYERGFLTKYANQNANKIRYNNPKHYENPLMFFEPLETDAWEEFDQLEILEINEYLNQDKFDVHCLKLKTYGYSNSEIADIFNKSPEHISANISRSRKRMIKELNLNIKIVRERKKETYRPNERKFTNQQVVEMRDNYKKGKATIQQIADINGVSLNTIVKIIRKKTYKNVA